MVEFDFVRPKSIDCALEMLHERGPSWRLIAGGTDVLTQLRAHGSQGSGLAGLIDISGLTELYGVRVSDAELVIGSLTTFAKLQRAPEILDEAPILCEMALHMGSPQIRHRATIGGNLANAAACADSVPPLLVLDAEVELWSASGSRRIPVSQFILGPGRTAIGTGEILTHIHVPRIPGGSRWHYRKLGRRNSAALSRLTVAALRPGTHLGDSGECRLAVGAVSPVPLRLRRVEASLSQSAAAADPGRAASLAREEVEAVVGRRWSSAYKFPVLESLVRRALAHVYGLDENDVE